MIDVNWNNFKAKFNEKENKLFERLSYILFCREFNIPRGIFRFKNQTGIETEPINIDGKEVGFQAKYYDTKLSANKIDIISSLRKAKEKNPSLEKILIYTNQELSESKSKKEKKPQYLKDIELVAQQIKVEIEWRVPSHFEVQLSLTENFYIAEYFFSLEKTVIDFLDEIEGHSESILFNIHSDIKYQNYTIKIERSQVLADIENSTSHVVILTGEGGVGKTAIIKDIFRDKSKPVYIFKATEFNLNSINELLRRFGDFNLSDFCQAHLDAGDKTVVIDAAEKLADLENLDPFKEFLSALVKNKWKIIFTTRYSYLNDLTFQLIEIYKQSFDIFKIENLTDEELTIIAKQYKFDLPNDQKLLKLISNPFYLDEYLTQYLNTENVTDYTGFRKVLWQKKIQNSNFKKNNTHLERERCFLELAKRRCDTGNFYIDPVNLDNRILSLLASDEIIQYEEIYAGYFITHDIYEEWALDTFIEQKYNVSTLHDSFFEQIGTSLPMRRAFRNWLSEKLSVDVDNIKSFVENAFASETIPVFWKDELLISTMLSDYSENFFIVFEKWILAKDKSILKKIIFLLNIACKEVDRSFYANLSEEYKQVLDNTYLVTSPLGKGWKCCIEFIYKHREEMTLTELPLISELLEEWTKSNKSGKTTKYAALFALQFYHQLKSFPEKLDKKLMSIFMLGTAEIKEELIPVLEELSINLYQAKRSKLVETILTVKDNSHQLIAQLPAQVLNLAYSCWYQAPESDNKVYSGGRDIEVYYSISRHWHYHYFPASAFQTPIYWCLRYSFAETIKFILDFTNRAIEAYVSSKFDNSVQQIEIFIDEQTVVRQYISKGLWNMYRGSGSPVTPYLLQSYHMALEKFLLEVCKVAEGKHIERWLIHLLKNTRSASISAIVASVVLAYPDKFFDVAIILFKNYSFLRHDNNRLIMEHEARSLYSIGAGLNSKDRHHENERLGTCNDPHRKGSLEHLAVVYQFFRRPPIDEIEVDRRAKVIQEIIDFHYLEAEKLDENDRETVIYKLLLARIDRRKMNPEVKQQEDKVVIHLNPELDDKLKFFTEEVSIRNDETNKFLSLKLWAFNKFDDNKGTKNERYDENPKLVFSELKEVVKMLSNAEEAFLPFQDNIIPPYACHALIKYYSSILTEEELKYCGNIIIEYATVPLRENYHAQISDGVEVAVNTIPYLYDVFREDHASLNAILLFILFDKQSLGEYKRVCDYAVEAIKNHLYTSNQDHAILIFKAYFHFVNKFHALKNDLKEQDRKAGRWRTDNALVIIKFTEHYKQEIEDFFEGKIEVDLNNVKEFEVVALESLFNLIPTDTDYQAYLFFAKAALPALTKRLLIHSLKEKENERIDYKIYQRFSKSAATFLLNKKAENLNEWITLFTDAFAVSGEMASFLNNLIMEEDRLRTYDIFWTIWEGFYEKIKVAVIKSEGYDLSEIVHNYLLAWPYWKSTAKEWNSLRERDKLFYAKISKELGHHTDVLYGIAKVLNEVASPFLNDGIIWISDMLSANKNLHTEKLQTNTIYYLEVLVRKYVYLNRTKLKSDLYHKNKLLVILNFLIEKASVNAYLLREDVL